MADALNHGGRFTTYLRRDQIPWPPHPGKLPVSAENDWRRYGHEVGVHVHASDPDGDDAQTEQRLRTAYEQIDAALRGAYGHGARTARSHTIEWVGWVDMAKIEAASGTGLDLNQYHYWEFDSPTVPRALARAAGDARPTGYVTGSGLPQRFCDEVGTVLPIFQLLTEWPDEFFYNNGFNPVRVFPDVLEPMLLAADAGYVSAFVNNIHHGQYTAGVTEPWVHALWTTAWVAIEWTGDEPAGTVLAVSVRNGDTPEPDSSWTPFGPALSSGAAVGATTRYLQYRAVLATTDPLSTPRLDGVRVTAEADVPP